jgi:ABC-type proline/glycine betaine transport system substrate-binding protein
VVEEVLRDLGHPVEVIEGPHAELYPPFCRGRADLFAASWLPRGLMGSPGGAFLLGYREHVERLPAATVAVLRRIRVTLDDITEMDLMINRQGMTPNEAARAWMNAQGCKFCINTTPTLVLNVQQHECVAKVVKT